MACSDLSWILSAIRHTLERRSTAGG